jgi:GT2 family glycosyltransferase
VDHLGPRRPRAPARGRDRGLSAGPEVSVVVATRDRRDRLAGLLDGLRRQTLAPGRFEVIVVDDGSADDTPELLAAETQRGVLDLRVIRLDRSAGPAAARNRGWRVARAAVVAFTDDDCVPDPGWLEAGLGACEEEPGAIVQGPTIPSAEEWERLGPLARPFTHTVEVREPDPHLQTCNVFYPRAVLEREDGFDEEVFGRIEGEDADLAWRAIGAGTPTRFAPDARVVHGRIEVGPIGKLRRSARWDLKVYAIHRGLRRAWFVRRVFWLGSHYLLARALLATLVPRRLLPVRVWLAAPYAVHLVERGRVEGGGPALAPYFALCDLLQLGAGLRASLRYRVPML